MRSEYYAWKKRGIGKRQKENALLKKEIQRLHKESDGNYGSPRITPELKNRGYSCGHNRVAKLMKEITKKLAGQMKDEERLDEEIKKQLKNIGFDLEE